MKKLFLTALLCFVCTFVGLCGINNTLNEAQSMFRSASTVAQYQTAKKKFQSAKYDVGYVAAEHDNAINEGVRKCEARIKEMSSRSSAEERTNETETSPRLSVNGSTSSTDFLLGASGGYFTLSVHATKGLPAPNVSNLPSWITVSSISSSEIRVHCAPNQDPSPRSYWFYVNAGQCSVRVNVSQRAATSNRNVQFLSSSFRYTLFDKKTKGDSVLYATSIRNLCWRIAYNGPSSAQTKTCYFKIIGPDGKLCTSFGSPSPEGFSTSEKITFLPGKDTVQAVCWGLDWENEKNILYKYKDEGSYRFELWYDGAKQYSASIMLYRRRYLLVDNKTFVKLFFESHDRNKFCKISASENSWTVENVPSWCSVGKTGPDLLSVKVEPSSYSRSGYMTVRSGDRTVDIEIKAASSSSPQASIRNVRVDHNVSRDGEFGMKIHGYLHIIEAKGRYFRCCACFYQSDNVTKLEDGRGKPISQCVTLKSLKKYYYTNMEIFVPYAKIFNAANGNGKYSFDIEIQDMDGSLLTRSTNHQFQANKK